MTKGGWNGASIWQPLMNWVYAYADATDPRETAVITERLNEPDQGVSAPELPAQERRDGGNRPEA